MKNLIRFEIDDFSIVRLKIDTESNRTVILEGNILAILLFGSKVCEFPKNVPSNSQDSRKS